MCYLSGCWNKRLLYALFFIVLFGLSSIVVRAQDAVFSQYYSSGLYLNPALAGTEPYLNVSSNYRMQWRTVTDPYTTSQISVIKPLYIQRQGDLHAGGFGFSLYNDRSGQNRFMTNGANINFAYNVYFNEFRMSSITFGIQAGVIQKSINTENLQWGSQYNPFVHSGYDPGMQPEFDQVMSSVIYPDLSAGILYYYNSGRDYNYVGMSGYLGASVYHINEPNESLVKDEAFKLPRLYKFHGGFEAHVSEKLNISPNFIVAQQGDARQINGGLYLTYIFSEKTSAFAPTEFLIGGWYRVGDSFIAATGLGNKYYTLAFSYDVNNTSLRYNSISRGAYEISLKINKPRTGTGRRFYTPRI